MFERRLVTILLVCVLSAIPLAAHAADAGCARTITAKVVALDQPYFLNRLGASMPEGMIYALERDVVPTSGGLPLKHGKVRLRDGKRPRPIVLRANVGDCVAITFRNLLSDIPAQNELPRVVQPATRYASVHIAGMMVVSTIMDDGSYAGTNYGAATSLFVRKSTTAGATRAEARARSGLRGAEPGGDGGH